MFGLREGLVWSSSEVWSVGRFGLREGLVWSSPEVWSVGGSGVEFSLGLVCRGVWRGVLQSFGL